jgi:hypothetical protein
MKSVFVLMREVPHEFCDCWGVFSTMKKAEEHAEKLKKFSKKASRVGDYFEGDDFVIYEQVLDEGDLPCP